MPSRFKRLDGVPSHKRHTQLYCHNLHAPKYPLFVAEIGSNHTGSLERAIQLIEEAKGAGAHAVKFQLFKWVDIARKAAEQNPAFELDPEWIPTLQTHAHQRDMAFLCTPFAPWAIPVLAPYVDAWKIGSFEALYTELVFALPADQKPLILSTGMTWDRSLSRLMQFLRSPGLILTHCISKYPTPYKEAGLMRVAAFKRRGFRTGYSSHTPGWMDVVVAATMGVCLVEKHIRLDDQPDSPDNGSWALRPSQFKQMIEDTHDAIDARRSRFNRAPVPAGRRIFGA